MNSNNPTGEPYPIEQPITDPGSLRQINLQLKNGSEKKPIFETKTPIQDDRPVFSQENRDRPRTHLKAQFFVAYGNREEPRFLFSALLHAIPEKGQLFRINDKVYEVRGITRNMDFIGDGNLVKEFDPDVLVSPYTPRPEKSWDHPDKRARG